MQVLQSGYSRLYGTDEECFAFECLPHSLASRWLNPFFWPHRGFRRKGLAGSTRIFPNISTHTDAHATQHCRSDTAFQLADCLPCNLGLCK